MAKKKTFSDSGGRSQLDIDRFAARAQPLITYRFFFLF